MYFKKEGYIAFNTAVARVETVFEFIKISEKTGCSSECFEVNDIVRQVYGSNGYVWDDENKWTCEENENSIIVCDTTPASCEEPDEKYHNHRIEPLMHEVNSCLQSHLPLF